MQLPVDVRAVLDEATNIDEARRTPLSVSVYIDNSAPADLQVFMRVSFASFCRSTCVSVKYMDQHGCVPVPTDDMAVVVAGLSDQVGPCAKRLRSAGVPTMVVTTLPELVSEVALYQGCPIPEGDLIAPGPIQQKQPLPERLVEISFLPVDQEEPHILNAELEDFLGNRMGGWIIEVCGEKRLAFALAFPFIRRPLSMEVVRSTALQNAGVGFLVIIPGADMPVMTLNQAKMLLMIAAAYGEELNLERVKELAAVVGGAFACRAVARQLVAFVPALGWALKAAIGYTGTVAMGRAAIEYYEDGARLDRLVDAVAAARDKVVLTASEHLPPEVQKKGAWVAGAAKIGAVNVAQNVRGVAFSACNKAVDCLIDPKYK